MKSSDPILAHFGRVLLLAGIVVMIGTAGYMLLEGWDAFDALYMTILTLTTVGFEEVHTMNRPARAFTVLLMVSGAGGVVYTLTTLFQHVLDGRLSGELTRRRIHRMVTRLTNHVIVCGYGRVGREVARQLKRQGVPFVILDRSQARVDLATTDGYLALTADAARDEDLQAAGVGSARALITAVDSDADNIYITLSARVLAPGLHIVARANDAESEAKLRRVGASRVLSPHSIGGRHMALVAVRSEVVDFLDMVMTGGSDREGHNSTMQIETLALQAHSAFAGLTFAKARALCSNVATLLAVTRIDGHIVADQADPAAADLLQAGDILILIGRPEQLRELEQLRP
ncbi:MAG TPA: potassium channel family protein [Chloroflexia bacterium]|nr:potassium channel family protein [Chloroflexia bacterium]